MCKYISKFWCKSKDLPVKPTTQKEFEQNSIISFFFLVASFLDKFTIPMKNFHRKNDVDMTVDCYNVYI